MQLLSLVRVRATLSAAALTMILFNLVGCNKETAPPILGTFRMGERIQVGPMTYNVLESRWKPALRDDGTGKPPKERYLLVKLTATNGGGSPGAIPSFTIVNARGESYTEVNEGVQDVPNYLGIIRKVQPAQTEEGWIVFDAPVGAYQLMISDNGEPGSEKYARVDLPVSLE